MKEIKKTFYQCDVCKSEYKSKNECNLCEAQPITHDKGVKIGHIVKILGGDGAGKLAEVKRIGVLDKDWGHYARERYHHTVFVEADVIDGWGTRMLTWDDYEPESKKP